MPAPEPEPESVESGWDACGAWGTWRTWAGGFASWHRHDAPAEADEDDPDPWSWIACRAIGLTLVGAPVGVWRAISWISDARGAAAERELHRTVPRAAMGYHLGQHDHHHLGAVLAHHRAEREMHLRRIWWRCIVAAGLTGGAAAGWVWLPRLIGSLASVTLLVAIVLGAVSGAHQVGTGWREERAGGDEWGDATGVPPAVDMPSPHRDQPRQAQPPTDTVVLMGVRGAFVPGDTVLPTAEIVNRCRNGGGWWAQVTTREMGMRLAAIGLKSVNTNMAGEHGVNPKGFRLAAIISALAARTSQPDHDE